MIASKPNQRRFAYDARNAQQDKARISQLISKAVLQLDEYKKAETVLWYLHCRSEVQTYQTVLSELLKQNKKIVIPYCTKDAQRNNHLGLWYLQDISELIEGTWNILEIKYEDLETTPLEQVRRVYEILNISGFTEIKPAMQA